MTGFFLEDEYGLVMLAEGDIENAVEGVLFLEDICVVIASDEGEEEDISWSGVILQVLLRVFPVPVPGTSRTGGGELAVKSIKTASLLSPIIERQLDTRYNSRRMTTQ